MVDVNRRYIVVIGERAKDMLLQHVQFLAQVSPQGAENLRIAIIEAARSLEQFPERHPWLADPMLPTNEYRKMVVDKRYILIYNVKDSLVYIDYIADCRQDYQWLL